MDNTLEMVSRDGGLTWESQLSSGRGELLESRVQSISESSDLGDINDALRALRASKVHLIGPGVGSLLRLGALPYGCVVAWHRIAFNPEIGGPHVYTDERLPRRHVALKRTALLELWNLAGGREISSQRQDDGQRQHYARHAWRGEVLNLSGIWINQGLSKELDLRDGALAIEGMTADRVRQKRSMITQLAICGSQDRVIRALLGIRPTFDRNTIDWPFVLMKLVFSPVSPDVALPAI